MRKLSTLGALATFLLLLSCGGGKAPPAQSPVVSAHGSEQTGVPPPDQAATVGRGLRAPPVSRLAETAVDEALAELEALEVPEGVNGALFCELKAALREALLEAVGARHAVPLREKKTAGNEAPPGHGGQAYSQARISVPPTRGSSLTPHERPLTPAKLASRPPTGPSNCVDDLELVDNGDGTYTLTWSYRNVGDYNQDGIVSIMDLTPLAVHFNEAAAPENEWIDGNADTVINISDITPLAANFLTDCAGYSIRGASTYPASLAETSEVGTANFSVATGDGRKQFNVLRPESEYHYLAVAPFDSGSQLGELSNVVEMFNQRPVAALSADTTAGEVPLLVNFDASDSCDPDGSIVEFKWNFDGDATYDDTTTEPTNSHLYESSGSYNATVRVTDDEGLWDTAYVTIYANQPPVAAISAEPTEGKAPLAVNFDASDSSDADGEIVSYEWDFDGDSTCDDLTTEPTNSHIYESYGSYPAALRVTDDDGATDTASVAIEVNRPPVAGLSAEPTEGAIPLSVSFDASGSSDPDGIIVQYEWDFDGDATYDDVTTVPTKAHTYDSFGSSQASVRVTDDDGAQDTTSVGITVEGWAHTWGGADDDKACGVAIDSFGNTFLAGQTKSFHVYPQVLLLKYDSGGNLVFSRTWSGDELDYVRALVADTVGNLYLAGYTNSFGVGRQDVLVLKYDSSGSLLWQKTWGKSDDDKAYGVAVDSLGNVYVAGSTENPVAGRENVLLLKYDSWGNLLWQRVWGSLEPEEALGLFVDSSGNAYLAGYTSSFGNYQDVFLLKFNSDGELVFDTTWGENGTEETAYAVLVDSAGNIYVAGSTKSFGAGRADVVLLKYDSSGNLLWEKTWGGGNDETAHALAGDSSENIYLAGYTSSFGSGNRDVLLLKYSPDGELLLSKTWGGSGADEAHAISVDANGNAYLGGLALNAYGRGQNVNGQVSSPTGSTGTPGGATGSPGDEITTPEGAVAEQEGVEDEGGGYTDVLVIKYVPQ